MKLREFLKDVKKIIDENPAALDMEMIAVHGASGAPDPVGSIRVADLDGDDLIEYYLEKGATQYLDVYIGN